MKSLKNVYEIVGNELHLYLDRRDGSQLITIVDRDQFEKLFEEDVKWYPKWDEDIQNYYVQATKYLGVKESGAYRYKTLYLHKFVLSYKGRNKVDHINHNTLNNKTENLRVLEDNENSKNRKGRNSNNKSGYRNV